MHGDLTIYEIPSVTIIPCLCTESGNVIEVAIFFPSKVAFLSSLWTKLAEIWYNFNLT